MQKKAELAWELTALIQKYKLDQYTDEPAKLLAGIILQQVEDLAKSKITTSIWSDLLN